MCAEPRTGHLLATFRPSARNARVTHVCSELVNMLSGSTSTSTSSMNGGGGSSMLGAGVSVQHLSTHSTGTQLKFLCRNRLFSFATGTLNAPLLVACSSLEERNSVLLSIPSHFLFLPHFYSSFISLQIILCFSLLLT